jgi:hypothetical protein
VNVPEWGVKVTIRTMSGAERERLELANRTAGDDDQWRGRLLVATVSDEANAAPVFTMADAAALSAKSSAVLGRLATVATELNRIGDAEIVNAAKN